MIEGPCRRRIWYNHSFVAAADDPADSYTPAHRMRLHHDEKLFAGWWCGLRGHSAMFHFAGRRHPNWRRHDGYGRNRPGERRHF